MPKMSEIALLKLIEQPSLSIRKKVRVQDLPLLIGESYGKIAQYLGELGEIMADMPFVCYHNLDMQNLDIEIGFPVSKSLPEKEDIKPSRIPEGYIVFCMYRGPYKEMEPVYIEMAKWIEENGLKPTGISYEFYFNGPEFPESELLTKIVMPVKR
jgi:effector-binding domain-containing protein